MHCFRTYGLEILFSVCRVSGEEVKTHTKDVQKIFIVRISTRSQPDRRHEELTTLCPDDVYNWRSCHTRLWITTHPRYIGAKPEGILAALMIFMTCQ
jgi:hypothetical protein